MIYDEKSAINLLRCIAENPLYLFDTTHPINLDKGSSDFALSSHRMIAVAIYNLANNGAKKLNAETIEEYIKAHSNLSVECVKELINGQADINNYEMYYNNVRKCSLLRYYEHENFDVSQFKVECLDKFSIIDINNFIEQKLVTAKRDFEIQNASTIETRAGENYEQIINEYDTNPVFGSPFCSQLLNGVTGGLINGQLYCFSSPSGVGKTTLAISEIVKKCATRLWNEETNGYIDNECKVINGALYIQFELDNVKEITPKFLGMISGINPKIITKGHYENQELKDRLMQAGKILYDSHIIIECMPTFTQREIDIVIKNAILKNDINFVVFDYIADGAEITKEINQSNGGVGLRTDQILARETAFLKNEARLYNIPIYTMTQTNSNIGVSDVLGEECISGSRAVAQKLDTGGVFLPLRAKEIKAQDFLFLNMKNPPSYKATHIYHLYKARFSVYPKDIKLWVNFDLGTGVMKDCFATTWDDKKIIQVEKLNLTK